MVSSYQTKKREEEMTPREEFKEAFQDYLHQGFVVPRQIALWAASWAFKKSAEIARYEGCVEEGECGCCKTVPQAITNYSDKVRGEI
jgi:hypothetical protein